MFNHVTRMDIKRIFKMARNCRQGGWRLFKNRQNTPIETGWKHSRKKNKKERMPKKVNDKSPTWRSVGRPRRWFRANLDQTKRTTEYTELRNKHKIPCVGLDSHCPPSSNYKTTDQKTECQTNSVRLCDGMRWSLSVWLKRRTAFL